MTDTDTRQICHPNTGAWLTKRLSTNSALSSAETFSFPVPRAWHFWRDVPVVGRDKTSDDLGAMHTVIGTSIWKRCRIKCHSFRVKFWRDDWDAQVPPGSWPMKMPPKAKRREPTVLDYFTEKERQ